LNPQATCEHSRDANLADRLDTCDFGLYKGDRRSAALGSGQTGPVGTNLVWPIFGLTSIVKRGLIIS